MDRALADRRIKRHRPLDRGGGGLKVAGELGEEGFQTALRLGGGSVNELKRILFRPPPKDD